MNDRMHAKIECCLELAQGTPGAVIADDFKAKVLKVTGISNARFHDMGLTDDSYRRLIAGFTPDEILKVLF
jgi:hypothetical protein